MDKTINLPDGRYVEVDHETHRSHMRLRLRFCKGERILSAYKETFAINAQAVVERWLAWTAREEELPAEFAKDMLVQQARRNPDEEIWQHRLRLLTAAD